MAYMQGLPDCSCSSFNRFALNPTYQFAFPKIPTSWDGTFEGSVLFYEGSSNGQAPIVLSCL